MLASTSSNFDSCMFVCINNVCNLKIQLQCFGCEQHFGYYTYIGYVSSDNVLSLT